MTREELIKHLIHIGDSHTQKSYKRKFPVSYARSTIRKYGAIADFIISERKKIVDPLVKAQKEFLETDRSQSLQNNVKIAFKHCIKLSESITQAIKNSGVE